MSKRIVLMYTLLILPLMLAVFFLQVVIGSSIFFLSSLHDSKQTLQQEITRVKEDIKYDNGKWDTSQYNADSDVPSINPLYIITADGFVIDRWRPIHGLLDASEFTRILTYTSPQTISTITNENWRVLSQPISNGKEIVGVILVTAYKPDQSSLQATDVLLKQTLDNIQKSISIHGTSVDVSQLDPRKLPFTITYQIVNKFNKIIALSDNINSITRTPTFIDTSYIDSQLKAGSEEQIVDSQTKKRYLIERSPIYNKNNEVIGIIVAGAEIESFYKTLSQHIISFIGISSILVLFFSPLFVIILKKFVEQSLAFTQLKKDPQSISFNKQESKLHIDELSIDIPYASYQYYFCEALFAKPHKRWEVDELIERFGENQEKTSWRKVYDTMLALNKKLSSILSAKLFIVNDKTFRMNPIFVSKIKS